MVMPSFLNPLLLWGLALVAVPVLIHLINLLRHRRVRWAAMDFLLASQKQNQRWVRIRELLLLLARMGIIAAAVLMLAQPVLRSSWSRWLGTATTHHVVLLDDSYSMTDRWADTDAFTVAKRSLERMIGQAAVQGVPQSLTLLRFSQAAVDGPPRPDLMAETITADFAPRLESLLAQMEPTDLAIGPTAALQSLETLLGSAAGENRVVYLVSDFRAPQWQEPDELRQQLAKLADEQVRLELVSCVDQSRPNLAIQRIEPLPGNRAAGVPQLVEVTVRNFGSEAVGDVSVLLAEDGSPRPAVVVDQIAAGQSETRRFAVRFPTAGAHHVQASLQSDAVEADNQRHLIIDLPLSVPVLIIDGDADAGDAQFLTWALAPGGPVQTGVAPQVELPRFLDTQPLDRFRVIYLTNIDRLDPTAITAIEEFVARGGGLAFFCGERTDPAFVTSQLYRNGAGCFPLPVLGTAELLVDRLRRAPDLNVADHPVFGVFAGERNSFLQAVVVERYLAAPADWRPEADSSTRVLASLRNEAPLVVEREFGAGRVVAMLTTAAPEWNNWAQNPSFVVTLLELQAYLAGGYEEVRARLVGEPLEVVLDAGDYRPRVRFTGPDRAAGPESVEAASGEHGLQAKLAATNIGGLYTAELTRQTGEIETRRFALNVDASEGDLTTLDGAQLASRLEGLPHTFHPARELELGDLQTGGFQLSEALLFLLIALLIGEQLLAYTVSYHPQSQEVAP